MAPRLLAALTVHYLPQEHHKKGDHDWPADELGDGEPPTEQHDHHYAKLEDEIR